MLGIIFAILSSIFHSFSDVFKKKLSLVSNEYVAYWGLSLVSLPVFLITLSYFGLPEIKPVFWLVLPFGLFLNLISFILLFKALKYSPLSKTLPFLAFTPVFLLLTSWLFFKELPNQSGLIGILLIAIGAYFINFNKFQKGLFEPYKEISREKGSLYALIISFIWSITSNLDKVAIQNSSPYFYLSVFFLALVIILSFIVVKKPIKSELVKFKKNFKIFLMAGLVYSLAVILQMLSLERTLVAYTISIKRAGLVLGVLWGYYYFKEKNIKQKLLGVIIMVTGLVIISIFG